MKKLVTSNIVEGVRKLGAVKAFFEHMESAYITAISDLVVGLAASSSAPVSLYGVVNSGSGSNFNISAGAIFHNGEVFTIPAFSGNAPGGQVPTLRLIETKQQLVYTDGSNQDTLNTRTYVWQFGAAGSGLANFSDVVTLKQRINSNLLDVPGQINTAVNALVASAPGALDTLNELAAALGNDSNFATTVTSSIAGKVAKSGDSMSGVLQMLAGFRNENSGIVFKIKIVPIGDWNMDANPTVDVPHGIADPRKIRSVRGIIRRDDDQFYFTFPQYRLLASGVLDRLDIAGINASSNFITLERVDNGSFDIPIFDSTGFNRGWLVIEYEP
jgi:hypothetical protein